MRGLLLSMEQVDSLQVENSLRAQELRNRRNFLQVFSLSANERDYKSHQLNALTAEHLGDAPGWIKPAC